MAEITWAPYIAKMNEQLQSLSLTRGSAWKDGESLGETFTAEKLAKIGIAYVVDADRLRLGLCSIFPAHGFDLPIFLSRWEERRDAITFLVDLIPTVDTLVDEPYRKKYVESLDPLWQRYESLAGICPEEHDGMRGMLSIIYTAARVPIEREGMRIAALAPHLEYLKHYMEFCRAAAPVTDSKKLQEISRRSAAVTRTLQAFLSGLFTGPVLGKNAPQLIKTVA